MKWNICRTFNELICSDLPGEFHHFPISAMGNFCPNTLESALQSEPESADLTASDDLCLLRSLNVHLTFLKSSATMATEFCRKLCQAHALHRHGTKTYYKHPKFNASEIWALASQVVLTLLLNEFKLHSHWRQHLKYPFVWVGTEAFSNSKRKWQTSGDRWHQRRLQQGEIHPTATPKQEVT